jgi:hypothetical protein
VVRRLLGAGVRLIVSLRDPVERALSAWAHYVAHGELDAAADFRTAAGYGGIVDMGFYGRHLERWYSHFPAEQILVLGLERDIVQAPAETLRRCFRFLGVSDFSLVDETIDRPVFAGPVRTAGPNGGIEIALSDGRRLAIRDEDLQWLRGLYDEDRERLEHRVGPGFASAWPPGSKAQAGA